MKQNCSFGVMVLAAAAVGCTASTPVGDFTTSSTQSDAVAAPALEVQMPSELTPMTVGVALSRSTAAPGESVAVTVGVRLLPGWHTYAVVPPEEPYIQTRFSVEPQAGVTAVGDWIAPPPVSDPTNPALKIYESTPEPLMFVHELRVAENASGEVQVRVSVLYQTCDLSRCLPPEQKTFDLKLQVAS